MASGRDYCLKIAQGAGHRALVEERSDEPTKGSSAKPNPDIPKDEGSSRARGKERRATSGFILNSN